MINFTFCPSCRFKVDKYDGKHHDETFDIMSIHIIS